MFLLHYYIYYYCIFCLFGNPDFKINRWYTMGVTLKIFLFNNKTKEKKYLFFYLVKYG